MSSLHAVAWCARSELLQVFWPDYCWKIHFSGTAFGPWAGKDCEEIEIMGDEGTAAGEASRKGGSNESNLL
jgi:hypothetical protein